MESRPKDNALKRLFSRSVLGLAIFCTTYAAYFCVSTDQLPSSTVAYFEPRRELSSDGSAPSLFGIVSHLSAGIGTASVILVVAAVLCVEYAFHVLHELTYDTPFEHLVPSVEKELMLVGFTAFIFKIVVTVEGNFDQDWYHALEYADILVPLFSFSYCALGLVLIVKTVRQCDAWSKAYHVKLMELLDDYLDATDSWFGRNLSPAFSRTLTEMEFRIFHNIFCDTFKIQRRAFAFNEYVEKVADTFVQNLITIRLVDWFLVCVLVVLNLVRNKLGIAIYRCAKNDYACYDRSSTILLTIAGGVIFFVTLFVAVLSRRIELKIMEVKGVDRVAMHTYLEHMEEKQEHEDEHTRMDGAALKAAVALAKVRSMSRPGGQLSGIKQKRAEQLANRLTAINQSQKPSNESTVASGKSIVISSKKMIGNLSDRVRSFMPSISSRKEQAAPHKTQIHANHIECNCIPPNEPDLQKGSSSGEMLVMIPMDEDVDAVLRQDDMSVAGKHNSPHHHSPQQSPHRQAETRLSTSSVVDIPLLDLPDEEKSGDAKDSMPTSESNATVQSNKSQAAEEPAGNPIKNIVHMVRNSLNNISTRSNPDFVEMENHLVRSASTMVGVGRKARRKSILSSFIHTVNKPVYDLTDRSRDAEIDGTFIFSRPDLYFELVRGLMMILALYWALFWSNFIVAAHSVGWALVCACPIILASLTYVFVVAHASLLMAVHSIDTNAVLEVLEQTEGSKLLGEQMREKLLQRLQEMGEPQAELFSLFDELNDSGNGFLSREEFAIFMNAIDIHFSRRKWQQIFREIDLNYDDKISFEELFLFLFPNHDVGLALERKRMKILGHRVKMKAKKRAESAKLSAKPSKRIAAVVPIASEETPSPPDRRRVGNIETTMRRHQLSPRMSVRQQAAPTMLGQLLKGASTMGMRNTPPGSNRYAPTSGSPAPSAKASAAVTKH